MVQKQTGKSFFPLTFKLTHHFLVKSVKNEILTLPDAYVLYKLINTKGGNLPYGTKYGEKSLNC